MLVRNSDIMQPLLFFDVSFLPENAVIDNAMLRLWVSSRTNENYLTAKTFLLRRPWDERETTQNQAATGVPWQIAGAHGESDRHPLALSSAELPASGPVDWDITDAVQSWVQEPISNYGLILSGRSTGYVHYGFITREGFETDEHPQLVVQYHIPPTPTPTPTYTPTPTFSPTPAQTPSGARQIDAQYGQAVIDGNLEEWPGPGMMLDVNTAGRVSNPDAVTGPQDSSVLVNARWDETHLYFAFDVRDDMLQADSSPDLWRDDSMEIGVDGEMTTIHRAPVAAIINIQFVLMTKPLIAHIP